MGAFRPERTVTGPDGRAWEIYVCRENLLARLRRARTLNVEAISFLPWRQGHLWTTNTDHVGRVVEQIARGMAAGEVARPLGAVYVGTS